MKKLLVTLFVFLVFALGANAQAPTPISIYASGAVSMPVSDAYNDAYKMGFHGSLGLGYKMAPNFQLIGKIEHHQFKLDFDQLPTYVGLEGGTNKVWLFGADGRFSFGVPAAPLKPFVLGGAGLAYLQQTEFSGTNTSLATSLNSLMPESVSKIYFNIGGGVDLATGPAWSMFAQVRYVSVATDGQASAWIPISLGVKFF